MRQSEQSQESGETTGERGDSPVAVSPETGFKIIGNETRLTILDTLWSANAPRAMTFAELRKAIGMRDGSQFNFHLKKLVEGKFVRKVDEMYTLRQAGARVICTIRTGYLTDHPRIDAFETTGQCYACAAPLHARYDDEMFDVECSVCDRLHVGGWFPPAGLRGRTAEEALIAYERTMRAAIDLASAGICPVCNGPTDRTVSQDPSEVPAQSPSPGAEPDRTVKVWYVCDHCNAYVTVLPGALVLGHPAVVALYRDHGVDLGEVPRWELPWTVDPSALDVVSVDPFRARLRVAFEGESRVLTLDEAFDVVTVE